MKRFHVHVAVDDLEANIRFYSSIFGTQPTVHKPQGVAWETYRTLGEAEIYGAVTKPADTGSACCSRRPTAPKVAEKCC